ncbi:hypothetical protein CONPUDRAFT_168971 [Coniophora puteana RWD-64-598 SS2]|uniref:Uncharacterized protein n=1 Tax=Coniophora puteana (strain RWD-64-598) TaxID=741705 RepID=A0A5M3MAY1_CONPW|nr:uncharacterized protein CONPUDRAFT_168971 [Coniophora puteana RWD-64-598 SS2]EIW76428.1 hypothetical protein CONPUDRAFT_168971 [Coniophora puteana RWD-64-598 SS2]
MPTSLQPLRRRNSAADAFNTNLIPPPRLNDIPKEARFKIGNHETSGPLVSTTQVKAYLRLLRAFHQLKVSVEDDENKKLPRFAMEMDKISRWTWFVTLAVDRFEKWLTIVKFAPLDKFLNKHFPPLDVWMVWHAYLLNPIWYAEDCERVSLLRQVKLLNMFVVGSINYGGVPDFRVRESRISAWQKQTGIPFDPFESMAALQHRKLHCPKCGTRVYVPFINDNGTGYAQRKFSALCPVQTCRMKITRDSLAVAKFVSDLTQPGRTYMAGTLYTPYGKPNYERATAIKNAIGDSPGFKRAQSRFSNYLISRIEWEREIKDAVGYSRAAIAVFLSGTLREYGMPLINRIVDAYADDKPFSIELVEATLRQNLFVSKLEEISWLKGNTFRGPERERILSQTVVRYHSFLDLTAAHPSADFVPTMDIDVAWHCHQLMANRYHVDCELYIGRIVDHELRTPEPRLTASLSHTCSSWASRFRSPYMQCGCPPPHLPPPQSVLHRLGRLFSLLTHVGGGGGHHGHQVALHPAHAPATHPSVHGVVLDKGRDKAGGVGGVVEVVHGPAVRRERYRDEDGGVVETAGRGEAERPGTAPEQGLGRPGMGMGMGMGLPIRRHESTPLSGMMTMSIPWLHRGRDYQAGRVDGDGRRVDSRYSPDREDEPDHDQEHDRNVNPDPGQVIAVAEPYSPDSENQWSPNPDVKYPDQGYGWNTWPLPPPEDDTARPPSPTPVQLKQMMQSTHGRGHAQNSSFSDIDNKHPDQSYGYGWNTWAGSPDGAARPSSPTPAQMKRMMEMAQVQAQGPPDAYVPDSKRPDGGYGWNMWTGDRDGDDTPPPPPSPSPSPPPLPPKEMVQTAQMTPVTRTMPTHPLGPRSSAVLRDRPSIPVSWTQYQQQQQIRDQVQDWDSGFAGGADERFSHHV